VPDEPRDRLPLAALGFALAAALSSWNPLSAPFGVVVGLVSLLLAVRALRRAETRRLAAAVAVALSFLAVVAGAAVLALAAGVGRELGGQPVVQAPAREEVSAELDRAAERTRAARERAKGELDRLEPPVQAAPPRDARGRTR
jgi:NhaP-type Na+/H+ or K+/H+ antiporter